MNKYKYTATDSEGKIVKGNFIAENEAEMKEMLLKAGYYVTSSRQMSNVDLSSFLSISGKVKVSELSTFCNQFSVMISAGISIVEAVDVCVQQKYSNLLRNTLKKVQDDLKSGLLLSDAMAKHPKIFPPFFTSMIYVGEAAGCLDRVLITVAEYYEFEEKTKKKVRASLAYPAVLLALLVGVVVVMMLFIIPTFIDSFAKMDVEMPALTMMIFDMSVFFKQYGMMLLGGFVALIVIMWLLKFLPSVQFTYDKLKVTLPLLKKVNMALFTSRFCRSLGLLLSSGADSLTALESLKKTITNKYLAYQFDKVINNVRMGLSLSASIGAEMDVSPVLIQMIVVGERTGDLDKILTKTAPYFNAQAEASLAAMTGIIQPTIMVLLGVTVAILFVAMYSPILNMITGLQTNA